MNYLKKKLSLTLLLSGAVTLPIAADDNNQDGRLFINEIMQSNIDCIMDDLNEFPDSWVELYNSGSTAVNLKDYKIGVKEKAANAFQLPDKVVEPNSYILVYCDKVGQDMHTDFRLESGKGCVVYLFKDNEIIDRLPEALKKQPSPNIAYGRKTDGSEEWGYQLEPTPGKANKGKTCKASDILGEPVFSKKGCVLTSNGTITLTLSLPEGSPEGTIIRYTTDGTEPNKFSKHYNSSLSINSSTVIRAKLFCDGKLSPCSTVQSYIFLGRDMTIPVISITTSTKYLNDSKIGIFANNKDKNNKVDWRRPINFELFDAPNENSVLNQLCETRVMGGQSREASKKSMAVYANKRFGEKRLNYEFFPDQKPGLKNFKSIMLRNAGNDFDYLYMRDAIIQRSMAQNADLDWQAWRPAVIFINGTYHCMLNIRERSNDDNIFSNYNELEDIDMMEIAQENDKLVGELKAGSKDNYDKFVAFYNEKGHTLAEYDEWMDWKEYINLMVMNLYFNNQDFPGNNLVMWRPTAEGGKWRWITKDTDFGLGLYGSPASYKTIEWIYNPSFDSGRAWGNTYEATRLFRRLMDDQDFNREFIDRCAIYMGDFLNNKGVRKIWDPMYNMIKTEYPIHRKLINEWWPNYSQELNTARNWLTQRTNNFYQQLASYYELGTPCPLVINKDASEEVKTIVNGIEIKEEFFDGKFFADRQLTVEGIAEEGHKIKGWKVVQDGKISQVNEPVYSFIMPKCNKLQLTAILSESSGIETMTTDSPAQAPDVYDLNGRKVRSGSSSLEGLPKGIYIIGGKKVVK